MGGRFDEAELRQLNSSASWWTTERGTHKAIRSNASNAVVTPMARDEQGVHPLGWVNQIQ